jgi:hypothetical protein
MNDDYKTIRAIQDSIATQIGRARATGFYPLGQCPYCNRRDKAAVKPGVGFNCYSCKRIVYTLDEWSDLAARLATPVTERPKPLPKTKAESPKTWQHDPMKYHSRYISGLDVAERWQAYKPISEENVMRYQLGYGVLPPIKYERGEPVYTMRCNHLRLIYANIENSPHQPVAFRGRQIDCACKNEKPGDLKWLTVAGARKWLWNSADLKNAAGRCLIVAENPIDAILIMQAEPTVYAIAGTAGAGTWDREWSQMIAAANPTAVLVWYDNDLIGNPTEETRESMLAAWIAKERRAGREPSEGQIHQERTKAMGPKIAAQLQALGVKAQPYTWADGTRPKMDAGQYLVDSGAV